jgi:alpha-amylase
MIGFEAVKSTDYTHLGAVTEFKFSKEIGNAFIGNNDLKWLRSFGECWGFLPSNRAVTFVDNHDNQRDGDPFLNYKRSRLYKMATAFHAAWPYGIKQYMSSFAFNNRDDSPPMDANGELISPTFTEDGSCIGGFVCEHRWRQIYNMIGFDNAVKGTSVTDWWDNGHMMIAFGRGENGFIAINGEPGKDMNVMLQTSLPPGVYCDVISGHKVGNTCTGFSVVIDENRKGFFQIADFARDGVLAIHINSKLN